MAECLEVPELVIPKKGDVYDVVNFDCPYLARESIPLSKRYVDAFAFWCLKDCSRGCLMKYGCFVNIQLRSGGVLRVVKVCSKLVGSL